MSTQISLTVPTNLLKTVKQRSKEQGFRSVQEYFLQCARDKIFLDNLPRYERLLKESKNEEVMTKAEFLKWLENPEE